MSRTNQANALEKTFRQLNKKLSELTFSSPVTHVYNPLEYARRPFQIYLQRYLCGEPGRTLLLGMNPGPWGMAQTGVPFGEIRAVKEWLGIEAAVESPENTHPKRPVQGFSCTRSEVSGRRLWGLFEEHFPDSKVFAKSFVVFNYCPLIFLEDSGRNRTPDKLPKSERDAIFEACDQSLVEILDILAIERALGVGKFAEKRLKSVKQKAPLLDQVSSILHPSPASPAANRGWAEQVAPVLNLTP